MMFTIWRSKLQVFTCVRDVLALRVDESIAKDSRMPRHEVGFEPPHLIPSPSHTSLHHLSNHLSDF